MKESKDHEFDMREQMAEHGKSLFERGFGVGTSGNLSVRLRDGILVSPTNVCLGRLEPDRISKVDWDGRLICGDKPSKETFLHLAMYRQRPQENAVVHLHSTYSVAVSCLSEIDPSNVLPAITAYYIMRVGQLPLVPYYPPGDAELAKAVDKQAISNRAMLLANHGPVIAATDLDAAVAGAEELEETAKLFLLLRNAPTRLLTAEQAAELRSRFS